MTYQKRRSDLLVSLKRARQRSLGVLVGLALLAMMCVMSAGSVYAQSNCSGQCQNGQLGQSPTATPELDSLFLFGTGVAGVAGYAALRIRARRR